ncbi:MAG: hypothetical protein KDA92_06140 [Planctomycetales bacterium]|nr:hypothetical protein [Planctomycetales bacterium]
MDRDSLISVDRTLAKLTSLERQGNDQKVVDRSPADRFKMVWPLTMSVWAFKDPTFAESRLQRHIVRVIRRER